MVHLPLSISEFRRALHCGLGRALLHAREFGIDNVWEELLDVTLMERCYDWQVDGNRADWVIQFYEERHLAELCARLVPMLEQATGGDRDQHQRARIAFHLARRGFHDAHRALFRAWRRSVQRRERQVGTEELLELGGEGALRAMAQRLPDPDKLESLECSYDTVFGEGSARPILLQERSDWQPADDFSRPRGDPSRKALYAQLTGNQLVDIIRREPAGRGIHSFRLGGEPFYYRDWGPQASTEDKTIVLKALLRERGRRRLCKFLRVFTYTPMPQLRERVLRLAFHDDEDVRFCATAALGQMVHERVRKLAKRKLQRAQYPFNDVGLWLRNYRPGDVARLRRALARRGEEWDRHRVITDLVEVGRAHVNEDTNQLLLCVYETSSCLLCRDEAVDELRKRQALPEWVERELAFSAKRC